MGPTWVLVAPDGPHVGLRNLANRGCFESSRSYQHILQEINAVTERDFIQITSKYCFFTWQYLQYHNLYYSVDNG